MSRAIRTGGPPRGAGPHPSPAETDEMVNAELLELSQRHHKPALRSLIAFVNAKLKSHRTEKRCESTNIIDQGEKATYALPPKEIATLMGHLEACRLEGSITHWSERQGSAERLYSGIMYDFDMVVGAADSVPELRHYHRLCAAVAAHLRRGLDLSRPIGRPPSKLVKFNVFFIVKKAPTLIDAQQLSGEATPDVAGPPSVGGSAGGAAKVTGPPKVASDGAAKVTSSAKVASAAKVTSSAKVASAAKVTSATKVASDSAAKVASSAKVASPAKVNSAAKVTGDGAAKVSNGAAKVTGDGAATAKTAGQTRWKYGMHVLIPGVGAVRSFKRWSIGPLASDEAVVATLRDLGVVGDPTKCLDPGSASVPVLFFGSSKRGAIPYVLGAAFEVSFPAESGDGEGRGGGGGAAAAAAAAPVVRQMSADELKPFNLAYELSLTEEAVYEGQAPPLVAKLHYDMRPAVAEVAEGFAARAQDAVLSEEELLVTENSLSTLMLDDIEARTLHSLLALLPPSFSSEYAKWRDVVFALANTSPSYRPLAEWFSQRCPQKWAVGGAMSLDAVWDSAVRRTSAAPQVTMRSIVHWAKEAAPEKFSEVMSQGYYRRLMQYVYKYEGDLGHYMIAKVLHIMLGSKFCVDVGGQGRGAQTYCWYEFVSAGQAQKPGEVWKWRREDMPDTILVYISEALPKVMAQVAEDIAERQRAAAGEELAKYYKKLGDAFKISVKRLFHNTFKQQVLHEALPLFRRRGFAESLDTQGQYLGTGNGVLVLGPQSHLISSFHEIPISRFTTTCWRRLDPACNPWDRIVITAVANIIPEPDARDWIMFFMAASLDGNPKEGQVLVWEGGGANGKTSFITSVANSIGKYARKLAITLFTSEREAADKPNSAFMALKGARFGYVEELNKAEKANTARLKEIINPGKVTGSEKYSRQEEFMITCNICVASQYSFSIEVRDHGTWRRISQYKSKIRFKARPDPNNPFERVDDQRYVRDYPSNPDYLEAMLALLVHYYERLQREFRGEIKKVHSNTIRRETEAYRNSQDTLNRFISERIVISPESDAVYPISSVGASFVAWYSANIDHKKHVAADVIKELESSAISKYLVMGPSRTLQLVGCRILGPETSEVFDGEDHLTLVEMRGKQTLQEWEEECARADKFLAGVDGDPALWWQGRIRLPGDIPTNFTADEDAADAPAPRPRDEFGFGDDAAVLQAERAAGAATAARTPAAPARRPPPWRSFDGEGNIVFPGRPAAPPAKTPAKVPAPAAAPPAAPARRPPPWRATAPQKNVGGTRPPPPAEMDWLDDIYGS